MPLILALILDLLLREPPLRVHPVVWMGSYLRWMGARLPSEPEAAFQGGAKAWLLGAGTCLLVGIGLQGIVHGLHGPWAVVLEGLVLWPLFSLRMLFSEVRAVERGLEQSLELGRERLARIVSRDVSRLSETEVRESALECLAENLSDSFIAPLFWWVVLGIPGMLVYRFANTADACWGYRGEWEWKGKWAARADDFLNWIPARITAVLLGAWRMWGNVAEEARKTPSPNGGYPMGTLALVLGVRLSKPGVYVLHAQGRSAVASDLPAALRIGTYASVAAVVLALLGRNILHAGI
ncbi:MAG: cobalamin biosynthesis protein CobD [Fibrobacteria bacterium]|nr:cobalamin biosynthesis protein CobD [Fibrobacteria bacterium]